ncbi:response regulator transcription factor [Aurantiacibacter sediminis]|uniref:HTH luxR-type domain-containing protein n=1 Tax=Aurantiacibacter sediminis TaxID=2793064 RepID=A0ABS0N0X3_9SPHN|nr:LuxR C-terminal-related transcriptional regulator [Aurantiacibacter sediminis]MBH5321604.1 hypothetical protein [Aurantiacibacter sediminis]
MSRDDPKTAITQIGAASAQPERTPTVFAIIDSDATRGQFIAQTVMDAGYQAKIYDNSRAYFAAYAEPNVLFAHDEGSTMGVWVTEMVRSGLRAPRLVAYSEKPSARKILAALAAGACDYVKWPFGDEAVNAIATRRVEPSNFLWHIAHGAVNARERVAKLSQVERDVLRCLTTGSTNEEAAQQLGMEPETVKSHRARLMAKIDAHSISELTRLQIDLENYDRLAEWGETAEN